MATTYLSKTPASAGDRQTWTWSGWLKRANLGSSNVFFSAGTASTDFGQLLFLSSNAIVIQNRVSGTNNINLYTDRLFRDTSAWYHIVVSVDTTQATSSDRVKLYVNGTQETSFSTETYPSQNYNTHFNNNVAHHVGTQSKGATGDFYNGSMAHVHFIDGTAYDADTFGETDSTTGEWKPKTSPSVTYGTNGFFLKFENASSFGEDSSGNDNDFTSNGSPTQNVDTPTNVLATFNPLQTDHSGSTAFSQGNNTFQATAADWVGTASTFGVSSGKWYAEVKLSTLTTSSFIGIATGVYLSDRGVTDFPGFTSGLSNYVYAKYFTSGSDADEGKIRDQSQTYNSYGSNTGGSTGDIIGVALDLDNNKAYWSVNGTWENSADPSAGTGGFSIGSGSYHFGVWGYQATQQANFGNGFFGTTAVSSAQNPDDGIGIFEYDVPTGYRALCTKSINAEEYD